jgi:hypothetical protein
MINCASFWFESKGNTLYSQSIILLSKVFPKVSFSLLCGKGCLRGIYQTQKRGGIEMSKRDYLKREAKRLKKRIGQSMSDTGPHRTTGKCRKMQRKLSKVQGNLHRH